MRKKGFPSLENTTSVLHGAVGSASGYAIEVSTVHLLEHFDSRHVSIDWSQVRVGLQWLGFKCSLNATTAI
jgi:hypothetical protein